MSSTTIRHSGVLENTQTAAHFATGHPGHRSGRGRHYPPGFGPGEPHYEPDHLRHKPGDTWQIGGKAHDPDDPGPYGAPGWRPDTRTGRHRRGEAPDPLDEGTGEQEYRFSRMREDAYIAFIRDSEELHQAHYERPEPNPALVRLRWILRVLLAILYWRVIPFPERPEAAARRARAARGHDRPSPGPRLPQVHFELTDRTPVHRRLIGGEAR